jgi:hypothetical protein
MIAIHHKKVGGRGVGALVALKVPEDVTTGETSLRAYQEALSNKKHLLLVEV